MTGHCATHNSCAFFRLAGHRLWWFGQSACTQHNVVTIGGYTRQCKCSAYPSLASEPMMACSIPSLTSGPCSAIQSFHPAVLFFLEEILGCSSLSHERMQLVMVFWPLRELVDTASVPPTLNEAARLEQTLV